MASLIGWLAYAGARKSDGTAVATGTAYFYQPGTSNTQVTVYSDMDGLSALSQPVTLDGGGRAEVYTKSPVRVVVLDAAGATARLEDRANTLHASQVEIEQAGYTGTSLSTGSQVSGGRTDLSTVLGSGYTSFGPNFQYSESATATARNYKDAVGLWVTPQDFGAKGDDAADDTTAFQNAINRAMAATKGLFVPPGTYRITSGLTVTGASGAGLRIEGANRPNCILKNYSTTASLLTIDLSSAIESHIVLTNFQISASTTSSGAAVLLTNGDAVRIEHMTVAKHRVGFNSTAVSYTYHHDCVVASADSDGTNSKGFRFGAHSTALHCRTLNSTMVWGYSLEGANTNVLFCKAIAPTTKGFDISAANCSIRHCHATSATTGYVVNGIASASVCDNTASGCTTDLSTNASTTLLREDNPGLTTFSYASATTTWPYKWRPRINDFTSVNLTDTVTPSFSGGKHLQVIHTLQTSAVAYTIAAPSDTSTLIAGDVVQFLFYKVGANNLTLTWNAVYKDPDGSAVSSLGTCATQDYITALFRFDGTNFILIGNSQQITI